MTVPTLYAYPSKLQRIGSGVFVGVGVFVFVGVFVGVTGGVFVGVTVGVGVFVGVFVGVGVGQINDVDFANIVPEESLTATQ